MDSAGRRATGGTAGGAGGAAAGTVAPAVADPTPTVLRLAEGVRAAHGLPVLRRDPVLDRAAAGHARDMASRGWFGHRSPEGAVVVDRVARAEGGATRVRALGENVARGQTSAEQVHAEWMASEAHRENVLRPWTHVGLATADDADGRRYWVAVFGLLRPSPCAADRSQGRWC